MKIIDVIGFVLIALGISMTTLNFLAPHAPRAGTQSFNSNETARSRNNL